VSSLGFGDIAFVVASSVSVQAGLQSFNATVHTNNSDGSPLDVVVTGSLNRQTGLVAWTFQLIDPATAQPPLATGSGFLPPNGTRGQGAASIAYSVRVGSTALNGALIAAQGSVAFDGNAPFRTARVTNTV